MTAKTRNLTSSILLMAVSVYWFVEAGSFRPLSRLFPRVLAGIVFCLALVLGVLTLLGHGPVIHISESDSDSRHRRAAGLLAALVLWTALIPVAGLLIASVVGVITMGIITFRGHAGTLRAVLIALAVVGGFYVMFSWLLHVPFPTGLL